MSNWSEYQFTRQGAELRAKVEAGQCKLKLTKMKIGEGNVKASELETMTDLKSPQLIVGISSCTVSEDDSKVCKVVGIAASGNVENSFLVTELGLYATDPEVGEILYLVCLDSAPERMPNKRAASPVTLTYQFDVVTSNTANVTAVITPTGLATAKMIEDHRKVEEIDHPDESVTTPKIRDRAVTSAKIAERAIEKKHLRKGGIVADDIGAYSKEDVNKLLDAHRKKTPLDHPDGSVLKRHLGFEVYDKGETDNLLDTKVNKSGDTITGDLTVNAITAKNGFKGNLHGVAWEAEHPTGFTSNFYENQGWGNQEGRTIASWYTANTGGIDFRENGGQLNIKIDGAFYQGEGIHRVLDSSGGYLAGRLEFTNNVGTCLRGVMADDDLWRIYAGNNGSNQGYLAIDTADDGNEPIYVRQFTGDFKDHVRTATLLDANGNTSFPVSVTSPRFYANNWFRATGDTGLYFEDHGGGWHMTDKEWIRAYNGKNIYTSGKIRCDAGFEGDLRGTASNANNLGEQSLQWILEQIKAANTGIVASNLQQNGWIKFANGIILQWGSWGESVQEKSQWFVFPLAFPSRCFKAIVGTSLLQEHVNADMGYQVIALERTRAKIMTQHFSAHISGVLGQIKAAPEFIAIGI